MPWQGFPLTSITALKGTAKQFSGPMTQGLTWDVGSWILILFPVDILFPQSRTTLIFRKGPKSLHDQATTITSTNLHSMLNTEAKAEFP